MKLIGQIFGFRSAPGNNDVPVMGALELLQSYGLRGYVRPGDAEHDSRVWIYDARTIADGGLPAWISEMRSYLQGQGAIVCDPHNSPSPNGYRVSINGRRYLVYPYRNYEDLYTPVVSALQIVNDLLHYAGSDERAYLLMGDDDRGLVVFMKQGIYARLMQDRRLLSADKPVDVGTYDHPTRYAVAA